MAIETPASVVFRPYVGMIAFDGWEVSSVGVPTPLAGPLFSLI